MQTKDVTAQAKRKIPEGCQLLKVADPRYSDYFYLISPQGAVEVKKIESGRMVAPAATTIPEEVMTHAVMINEMNWEDAA